MSKCELLDLIRVARLRAFGCPIHGRHIRQGQCVDCLVERMLGVPMTPVSVIMSR